MTPNFGQGGAQAIEDAIVLAKAIDAYPDPASAFQAYENHRHARTRSFVIGSWKYGRVAQGGSPLTRLVRNYILPRIPDSVVDKQLDAQLNVRRHLDSFSP